MHEIDALVSQAMALAEGGNGDRPRQAAQDEAEASRVLQICNACRYCEGFCAVFPAMTRRLDFGAADIHFLANLCHNCGACLHACQYAPPHEFAVNVPRAMAKVRLATYMAYAWPAPLGALYRRNGTVLSIVLAAALALLMALGVSLNGRLWGAVDGSFYAIFPHHLLVSLFAPVFVLGVLALCVGAIRFWREQEPASTTGPALAEATHNVLTMKYLGGGHGEGCNEADDRFTTTRRRFHHLTFYGFVSCFLATCVATLYHYALGWPAPYPATSLPKMLGIAGGLALLIGTSGLFALHLRRHRSQQDERQKPMDRGFIALLFLCAASGLVLMLSQGTAALPLALCTHLGAVMAFFALMPYSKFAHGIYRSVALLKWAVERRLPNRLRLAEH